MFYLQPETTEAVRCWINDTEVSGRTDRLELKLTTIREACNFSVFYSSGLPETDCHSSGNDTKHVQCVIKDLTPGTLYQLEIISQTDGERKNVSAQTGKHYLIQPSSNSVITISFLSDVATKY